MTGLRRSSRRGRKSTRGVAALVSSMLLITITVGAFTMVWGITTSYLSSQRLGPLQQIRERITIEEIHFFQNSSGKYIGAYVRNTGKTGLVVRDLAVGGSILANSSPKSLTLGVGLGNWINASFQWSPGQSYLISVGSERGSKVTVDATP